MNEQRLIEKLRLIEALFEGATTKGEEVAAGLARERIRERLRLLEKDEPLMEYRFSMVDIWSRKVFVALLRRYGIKPYRYSGQRHTTVMARVSKRFVDDTLWPEFMEISATLKTYISEITDRVISEVIHQDSSEAEVVSEQAMISADGADTAIASDILPLPEEQPEHKTVSTDNSTQARHQHARNKKKNMKKDKRRR